MDCRGARVEAQKTAGRLLHLSRWEAMIAWTKVVVVEMRRRIPQRPPALCKPIFSLNPVTKSVLTSLQHMEACPHCRAPLESPLPGSLLQTRPVLQDLSEALSTFCTVHSHTWFSSMAWLFSGPFLEMASFVLLSCFLPLESKCFVGICRMVSTGLLWKLHL